MVYNIAVDAEDNDPESSVGERFRAHRSAFLPALVAKPIAQEPVSVQSGEQG